MSVQPLFTPLLRMGDLDLPNRIVMAPLTRMRAGSVDHVRRDPLRKNLSVKLRRATLQCRHYGGSEAANSWIVEKWHVGYGTPDFRPGLLHLVCHESECDLRVSASSVLR